MGGSEAAARDGTVDVIELEAPGRLRFARRAVPESGALLELEAVGVCGTDRHVYEGRITTATPCVLGHELLGRIRRLDAADGVLGDDVRAGDRVLVAPGVDCRSCIGCTTLGRHCARRIVYGFDSRDGLRGGFARLMSLLPGSRVYRVPESLPATRAVFAEMTACVASALRKAFGAALLPDGARVCVLGFGPAGLCAASLAAWLGTAPVVVERDADRRRLAHALGFDASPTPTEPCDVVVECAGTPAAFEAGLALLRRGGTLVEMGNFADLGRASVSPSAICLGDLRIVGSGETLAEDFPVALRAVRESPVDLDAAVTHVHRFEELDDPQRIFQTPGVFKSMLTFPTW